MTRHPWVSACVGLAVLGARSAAHFSPAVAVLARSPQPASSDWPMFGREPSRSNSSALPTGIDARNIASLQLQQVHLDGTADSSPIYLRRVQVKGQARDAFFVTTSYGKTIAIDAGDGAILWEYTPPGYASWAGTYRITNATPAADPGREFVYAASPDGHVQKLAVADGRPAWSTAITMFAEREKIASALNFSRGRVIAVTGGYIGDRPPYQGHVAMLDAASGRVLHAWNSLCSDRAGLIDPHSCRESGSAIWGRGGAVVDEASGNLLVATGNGRWRPPADWGDAVIELDPDASRVLGNYTPQNTDELDANDQDVGSTSPVALGGGLIAQGGKDGYIRLLSRQRMAGSQAHRGGEVQAVPSPSGSLMFGTPAVLHGASATWLIAADTGGTAAWVVQSGRLEQKWKNAEAGTSPLVAGGLLYVYNPRGGLRVYEPESGRVVATLQCDRGHWNSPIVADGRIALPEGSANDHKTSGVLDIWRVRGR